MNHKKLIDEVNRTVGQEISTPQDFDYLCRCVFERTRMMISVSTLKRAYGYIRSSSTPSLHTLNALAQYVGYESYKHFCQSGGDEASQSHVVGHNGVRTETLRTNTRIRLTWKPDRVCVVRYLGFFNFVVEEAVNTKLSVGDTFSSLLFIKHEPLFLNKLVHNGADPITYVVGKRDGIMFEIV